jgi:hypothetical protein
MNAGEARSIAERWVAEEVARSAGEVLCVFTHGSVNWMADEDPFPSSSDLDLVVVTTAPSWNSRPSTTSPTP